MTGLTEVGSAEDLLGVIRNTLRQALDAGCDDLLECADSDCGPILFASLAAYSTAPSRVRK